MGVGKLKRKMTEAGVFFDSRDVIEKEDMVQIFINSGRIVFEEEEEEEKEEEQMIMVEDFVHQKQSFDRHEEEVKRPRIDDEGSNHNSNYSNKVEVEDVSASSISSDGHQSLNPDAEILLSSSSQHDEQQPETIIQESNDHYSRNTPTTAYSYNESADITRRSVGELRQLAQTLSIDLSSHPVWKKEKRLK